MVLLNELKVNPPGDDATFEYIELKGAPGEALTDVYLVLLDSKGGDIGEVEFVVNLSDRTLGSNGLLVVVAAGHPYQIPAATTVVTVPKLKMDNDGDQSVALLKSKKAIAKGQDCDRNDDGTLKGVELLDGVGWGDPDKVYGARVTQADGDPDAFVRFPTHNTPNDPAAWYAGELADGTPQEGNSLSFDRTDTLTANFPPGGQLTPGAVNAEFLPAWSGVVGDATNPPIPFTLSAIPAAVTATSSCDRVVPDANLVLSGTGIHRTLHLTPVGVGYAFITVTATDANGNITDQCSFRYAASAAGGDNARFHARFHIGCSDASAAIALDEDYMLIADDEDQTLRLYHRHHSHPPLAAFDLNHDLGLEPGDEADLEAVIRVGDRAYWIGSHTNNSKGEEEPHRSVAFATDITRANAASIALRFVGSYTCLKQDLIAWDSANGHGLGADALGLKDSAAPGIPPERVDGFSIEGLSLTPGSHTGAYVGFRAPLMDRVSRDRALIVPVTNFTAIAIGNDETATFGAPIFLDLGGRGIRSIRRNANNDYLIVAGTAGAGNDFKLFTWTGNPDDTPVAKATVLPDTWGSFEAIVALPEALSDGVRLQLLNDNGDTDWYGDGARSKKLPEANHQKFRSDWVVLE